MHEPIPICLATIPQSAQAFIRAMEGRKVFAFYGEMGAGKTTFIKAVCRELGVADVVNSPTFALVNEYLSATTGETVYHFDFYRIRDLREAYDLGVEEYFYSGAVCLIEWPEKIEALLPDDAVRLSIVDHILLPA
jgi:tRNA threonylcarbamoyladenosine biosynthesis protein TsaE